MILGRTVAFASLAAVSLIYIFSYKSLNGSAFSFVRLFNNKFLLWGVAYGFILLFTALYVPFFNKLLGTVPLNMYQLMLALGVGVVVTIAVEIAKKLYGKKFKHTV
jgi:magnesium-transporting ATPase (P-type)